MCRIEDVKSHVKDVPMALVGNKIDLERYRLEKYRNHDKYNIRSSALGI
jgi:GTPase SAR1 family protein